ncbi:DUF5702 domain-containing protein [Bacillus kwashiorkori]|uniref:DUF5702 domain-containing protein n=1 Tax=Bacillus kwashiorkori TaxID=1522318 RepID=UPI000781B9E5|nr:DUF5702 domain-containing protein [Bacillus kwashiorkori]
MKRFIKRCFHKFIIDENGAVSIYLVLVSICVFLLSAVLIDFARILVAERKTEQAIQAGLRTTFSKMNNSYYKYGMLGRDFKESTLEDFQNAVTKNLIPIDGEGDYYKFVDLKLEESKIEPDPEKMLANLYTFENQAVEDMKYRAPFEITLEVIEGLMGLSSAMEDASVLVKVGKNLEKEAKERDKNLTDTGKHLNEAQKELNKVNSKIGETGSHFPKVASLRDIVKHFDTYKEIIEEAEKEKSEDDEKGNESPYSIEDARTFETNVKNFVSSLIANAESAKKQLEDGLTDLQLAETRNIAIKTILESQRDQVGKNFTKAKDYYNRHGKGSNKDTKIGEAEDNMRRANQKLDDYHMDPAFFTDLEKLIKTTIEKIDLNVQNSLLKRLNELQGITNNLSSASKSGLADKINHIKNSSSNAVKAVNNALNKFENRPVLGDEKETKDKEKQAKTNLENGNKHILKLIEQAARWAHDYTNYRYLIERMEVYKGVPDGEPNKPPMDEPNDFSAGAFEIIEGLFKELGDLLESGRNRLYVNEYLLTRFKSHKFDLPIEEQFLLVDNEVEFIIYGLDNTALNFGAALTEIFVIRFAINFIEAFTSSELKFAKLTGKFMLIAALAYALAHTLDDMGKLTAGKSIEFFNNTEFYTNYKDYLRFILLYHPRGSQMQRAMALIDLRSGKSDLTKVATKARGEITTSVDLWFLPGVAKLLSNTNVLNGKVIDGRYHIKEEFHYSY